jgi:MFS family permease
MSEPAGSPRLRRPRSLRAAIGGNPVSILLLLASLALTGYAVTYWIDTPTPWRFVIWFGAALIGHDLIAAPVYLGLDRLLVRAVGGRPDERGLDEWRRLAILHVRFPVLMSVLLLAMWYPLVLARSDNVYFAAAGRHQSRFLGQYLLVVSILFAGSIVLYAVRLSRAGGRSRTGASRPRTTPEPPSPTPPEPGTSPQ